MIREAIERAAAAAAAKAAAAAAPAALSAPASPRVVSSFGEGFLCRIPQISDCFPFAFYSRSRTDNERAERLAVCRKAFD